jgi:hypothetical protein
MEQRDQKKRRAVSLFFLLVAVMTSASCLAQSDSLVHRRNTVKYLLLNGLTFPNAGALSYERVTKPNQSFAITVGYVEFPKLGSFGSGIHVESDKRNSGYMVGVEYRFYLKKENKDRAPHGVFVGPYTNLFHFQNERIISNTDGTSQATLNSKITAFNMGAQAGYQFIIGNRWAIDMVFAGPAIARYGLDLNLEGDFDAEDALENELVEALADRFPLIKDLITDQAVSVRGKKSSWSAGFRYQINVGYHFGRMKKK